MESPSERRGARPARGPRAAVAIARGRLLTFATLAAFASLASLTACDAILGIPGHLETVDGSGGKGAAGGAGGAGGSGGTGGDGSIVLRDSRLAVVQQASADSATKVTQHALELGARACNPSGTVCIHGGLLTQGKKQ